jgi:hypothetical protein
MLNNSFERKWNISVLQLRQNHHKAKRIIEPTRIQKALHHQIRPQIIESVLFQSAKDRFK